MCIIENDHEYIESNGFYVCRLCGMIEEDNSRVISTSFYDNKERNDKVKESLRVFDEVHPMFSPYNKLKKLKSNNKIIKTGKDVFFSRYKKYMNMLKDFLNFTDTEKEDINYFIKKIYKYDNFIHQNHQRVFSILLTFIYKVMVTERTISFDEYIEFINKFSRFNASIMNRSLKMVYDLMYNIKNIDPFMYKLCKRIVRNGTIQHENPNINKCVIVKKHIEKICDSITIDWVKKSYRKTIKVNNTYKRNIVNRSYKLLNKLKDSQLIYRKPSVIASVIVDKVVDKSIVRKNIPASAGFSLTHFYSFTKEINETIFT